MFKRLKYLLSGEYEKTLEIIGETLSVILETQKMQRQLYLEADKRSELVEKVVIDLSDSMILAQEDIVTLQATISTSIVALATASGVKPEKLYKYFTAEKINEFKDKFNELIDKDDLEC